MHSLNETEVHFIQKAASRHRSEQTTSDPIMRDTDWFAMLAHQIHLVTPILSERSPIVHRDHATQRLNL